MKSFIVLTFVFLALAFYQMSGGADFQPRKQALAPAEIAPAPERSVARADPPAAPAPAAKPAATFQPAVTPARMEPAAGTTVAIAADPGTATTARVQTAFSGGAAEPDPERLRQVRSSLSQGLSLLAEAGSGTAAQELTLVSMGDGSARLVARPATTDAPAEPVASAPDEPRPDIREITGTRVNMRDGPGTLYPVVAQLGIGHEVEVLSDSGTGWLRLRTLPDQQLGWISASLVSRKPAD